MSRLLAIASLLIACGGSPSEQVEHPKADLTKSLPATLEVAKPKIGDPRPVHIHVYADKGVRALPHWKEDITDQIDYAAQVLTPLLGIRLQVDSIKDWDHAGNDVHEAIKTLSDAEPKLDDETIWVIGYIAPGDTAQKAIEDLAASDLLGRYVVVRAWAEKKETDALAAVLPDLGQAQRTEAITAHKRHKQTVVLLHALAHTLGAINAADASWVEHPLYSAKQSTFAERNRELMQMAIDARLNGGTNLQIAHDLLEAIEKNAWGAWIPNDHDDMTKQLRNLLDSARAGKTAAAVPAAAYEEFDRVRELAKRGEHTRALSELENLMATYPGNGTMQEERCEIMIAKPTSTPKPAAKGQPQAQPEHLGVMEKTTRQVCARVSELAPGDPSPHLAVGEALANLPKPDWAGAREELVHAAEKIANLKQGQPEAWQKLVTIYMRLGALTWVDETIAAGHLDANPAAAEVKTKRARYGIPPNAKFVKPENEGQLLAATIEAVNLIGSNKLADGERALATADKKWPGAPGLAAMRCDLLFRQNNVDGARAACNRALAADADESWALYLGGVLAFKDESGSGTKAGIDKLKRAIAVDPELGQAWRALGKGYLRAKDQTAHDELAKAYQAKFGQSLP